MERRTFLRNSLLTAGGVLLGGGDYFPFSERLQNGRTSSSEKETVLLMTAGDNNEHTFDQALSYFHIISGVLGGKEAGAYLAGGCTGCENTARQIAPEHLEKAYKMGLEL
ncbi:hypothetical protein [Phocaeicola sartorii]|uniref:hypothetical protein n=1 Tax=Phocaeicola sartorii TaxID=671267 RepID=UPI001F5687EB|nr:hypothetical protein [Phocaeicola sartorii]